MRAVICRAWGEVEALRVEEVAPPAPGPNEVLIAVEATGVNYADSLMVAGRYQTRPPFPFSPGLETAGVVAPHRATTPGKPPASVSSIGSWRPKPSCHGRSRPPS